MFQEVFRTGQPVLEHEITSVSAGAEGLPRTYLASYYPVAAADGQTEWVGCIVTDVTERRRAAEVLVQGERMEAVARVAGGVAHEVNNMMTVITGVSGFLEGTLAEGDTRAVDVAEIRRAADRAAGITRQLLAYSRQQLLQPTPIDLNEFLAHGPGRCSRACWAPTSALEFEPRQRRGQGARRSLRNSTRCWSIWC